jgi:hypothetical protein
MLIGYARVSTGDTKVECERMFEDTASGAKAKHTGPKRAAPPSDSTK